MCLYNLIFFSSKLIFLAISLRNKPYQSNRNLSVYDFTKIYFLLYKFVKILSYCIHNKDVTGIQVTNQILKLSLLSINFNFLQILSSYQVTILFGITQEKYNLVSSLGALIVEYISCVL